MVHVLVETYANCIDQTSAHLFYTVAAAENLLVYGADLSNAFAEAPPPKQGFFICPDCAFNEWWVNHKQLPPIPPGHVIPVLSAMQGHTKIPMSLGETCRQNSPGNWTHSNSSQTMPLFGHY